MSLAHKKYYEYDFHEKQTLKPQRSKKKKNFMAPKMYVALLLIGALFISVLFRYAAISEIKYHIYAENQKLKDTQIHIEKKKIELEGLNKTSIIETRAINEFGMKNPDRQQIVYLEPSGETCRLAQVSIAPPAGKTGKDGLFGNITASILNFEFMGD